MLLRSVVLFAAEVLFLGCLCAAQTVVTVRVIDARSGKPLRNRQVWIQFYPQGSQRFQQIKNMSGSDGIAVFHLPEPPPETIYISFTRDDLFCDGLTEMKIQELLTKGISAKGCQLKLGGRASHLSARPGEAILFVRRPPWWYRLLAPLERE